MVPIHHRFAQVFWRCHQTARWSSGFCNTEMVATRPTHKGQDVTPFFTVCNWPPAYCVSTPPDFKLRHYPVPGHDRGKCLGRRSRKRRGPRPGMAAPSKVGACAPFAWVKTSTRSGHHRAAARPGRAGMRSRRWPSKLAQPAAMSSACRTITSACLMLAMSTSRPL